MKALLTRIKRLETVHAIEHQPPVEFQIGYLKKLPDEYAGERHVVTVRRHTDGTYRWEERPGASPASEDSPKWIIRSILVGVKDGRPDYSWPEDAQS
jgi:hypothetical protein